jgi:aminoglycoside phosphotransferase (APT) family kinase protein
MTRNLLHHLLPWGEPRQVLRQVSARLDPFVRAWQPVALAHNDYYDDQMLIAKDTGKLALVDFEEIAPGEPMIDVGNFLAHQHRVVHFGGRDAVAAYRRRFREAALARFGWDPRELDLREAYGLFRLSTNPFHSLHADWLEAIQTGLAAAAEVLEQGGHACPLPILEGPVLGDTGL